MVELATAAAGDIVTHESDRGVHLIMVLAVRDARLPPFDEIRLSVLNELQMQRLDDAYEEYLAWLRQRADIRRNERLAR
jgi:parvulin-like peptidyl-prolyl isomerase